ncbi:hypothetical protein V5P93_002421 [Actinokineospora auranticolor]|nr:DUF6545 domain-containing protein [Actinokineospora auranticolor]
MILVLFHLAPGAPDFVYGPAGRTEAGGAGDPVAAWAFIAYSLYLGLALAEIARLSIRWSGKAGVLPRLRLALRLNTAGDAVGLLYCANKLVFQIALLCGVVPPWPEAMIGNVAAPLACALCLAGVSMATIKSTALTTPARAVAEWQRAAIGVRALRPLWTEVRRHMPEHRRASGLSSLREWVPVVNPAKLLYRGVIDIWDAYRTLRPLVPEDRLRDLEADARGRGLDDGAVVAVLDAAVFAFGLPAHSRAESTDATSDLVATSADLAPDLSSDLVRWRAAARAFSRSPLLAPHRAHL